MKQRNHEKTSRQSRHYYRGDPVVLGLATAKLFLEQGAKVMLVDLYEDNLKEAVATLNSANVAYMAGDVSKRSDVENYTKATLAAFGKIDVFFSNAGIKEVTAPIAEYPDDVFQKVMDVNVKGVRLGRCDSKNDTRLKRDDNIFGCRTSRFAQSQCLYCQQTRSYWDNANCSVGMHL